jgi:glycosyltransferase involved in cell wall biosynthesis
LIESMADTPLTYGLAAQSPDLDFDAVELAVILPTYQRPDWLRRTLLSLAAQRTARRFAVIVIENHASGGAGAAMAAAMLAAGEFYGAVLIEPRQGNCFAYNAGFHFAAAQFPNARFCAVIDDDEMADPVWIEALVSASALHGADVVGGPQIPQFEDEAGARAYARHPVFQPAYHASGPVELVHSTGNVLIALPLIRAMGHPLLDPAFNFTGGGDTDFFTRCKANGARFAWSNEAKVLEIVPPRRTQRRWITARALRNGMLSALIQKRRSPGPAGRLNVIGKSLALLAAAPFRSLALALRTGSLYAGSYHLMIAAGRIMAEFGYAQEQYRKPEKN